jgi:tetratricopeptide (TPR) repeat protein
MAQSYIGLARFGGMTTAEGMNEARNAARKALELNPDEPVALEAMGWVLRTADWDWRAAQKSFQRALALAPESPSILSAAAILYFNVGRGGEATALARHAVELDPLNAMAQIILSDLLMQLDDIPGSIEPMNKGLKLAPQVEEFRCHLAIALAKLKRFPEADALVEQEPSEAYRMWGRGMVAGLRGDRAALARAREALAAKHDSTMNGYLAMLYAAEGNNDEAFALMERTFAERDSTVCWIKTAGFYDSARLDPRWPTFLRKAGLADDQLK